MAPEYEVQFVRAVAERLQRPSRENLRNVSTLQVACVQRCHSTFGFQLAALIPPWLLMGHLDSLDPSTGWRLACIDRRQ